MTRPEIAQCEIWAKGKRKQKKETSNTGILRMRFLFRRFISASDALLYLIQVLKSQHPEPLKHCLCVQTKCSMADIRQRSHP